MERKKLIKLFVVISLALTIAAIPLIAACAKPAPTPPPVAPKPPPAPAPPTVAPAPAPVVPSPTPKPTPTAKPTTEIMLPAGRVGAGEAAYPLAQAMAYYLNRDSPWLRATVVSTPGMSANLEMVRDGPKKYIGYTEGPSFAMFAQLEQYKFYKQGRWIGAPLPITTVLITYDKNLKKIQDLAGKRVYLGRKGASTAFEQTALLKQAGILEKVKLDYGAFGGAATALKDGLADAAFMVIDHTFPATYSKGAFIQEIEARGPIYYVNFDGEAWKKEIAPKPGELIPKFGTLPVRIYPGALDDKTQLEAAWGISFMNMWLADVQMDEDIVYEFTRVLWERAGQFATWHARGAGLTKEFVPTYQFSEGLVHPGALKFYKERGIKVSNILDLLP